MKKYRNSERWPLPSHPSIAGFSLQNLHHRKTSSIRVLVDLHVSLILSGRSSYLPAALLYCQNCASLKRDLFHPLATQHNLNGLNRTDTIVRDKKRHFEIQGHPAFRGRTFFPHI